MQCTIEHKMAGMSCLAREQCRQLVKIRYCSGTTIYANLYWNRDVERRYGEGVTSLSVRDFQTNVVHSSDDVRGSNEKMRLA